MVSPLPGGMVRRERKAARICACFPPARGDGPRGGTEAAAGEDPRPEAGHEAENSHREDAVDLARETY